MPSKSTIGVRLGKYLKKERKERGLTIAEICSKGDLTPAYISRLEQGDYESPTLEMAQKIALALDMSLIDLLSACCLGTQKSKQNLPEFPFYLHEKYGLPKEAIQDLELYLEVVKKKYLPGK